MDIIYFFGTFGNRRKIVFSTLCILFSLALFSQEHLSQHALFRQQVFETSSGSVVLYLPAKLSPGQAFTSRIQLNPAGNPGSQQQKHLNRLKEYVLKMGDQSTSPGETVFQGHVPENAAGTPQNLILFDQRGKTAAVTTIPLSDVTPEAAQQAPQTPCTAFLPPPMAECGLPVSFTGPFDGDLQNTSLLIAREGAEILAESPGGMLFSAPAQTIGEQSWQLTENEISCEGKLRLLNLEMSAPKTLLNKGEQTTIAIVVSGMSAMQTPVLLHIENLTPATFTLDGGNRQSREITPGDAQADDTWHTQLQGTAVATGGFTVQARLEPPFDVNTGISGFDIGPVEPMDNPPPSGDPCDNPEFVANEKQECADIVRYVFETPLASAELDFENFTGEWKEHFRVLSQTMTTFEMHMGMIKYWIDTGDQLDKQAQQVQELAGIVKDGLGHGVTAFKEGGEKAMEEVVKQLLEDQVKSWEQSAASRVSETLGALYDLEDLAIRQIGLGIAKGLTGVYPDREADIHRRALQSASADLAAWVASSRNGLHWGNHPTLQQGIETMCLMLNALDQIERDFEQAVAEAGFICINCTIPPDLRIQMNKLRLDIETHIRTFGDTIDQIRRRLVEARAVANNKKAYEDIARLGSFQGNSQRQTDEINKVLAESEEQTRNAIQKRKAQPRQQ